MKRTQIEDKLKYYKEINELIKTLEAEKENLKKELVQHYFVKHPEYVEKSGKILASYSTVIRNMFNSKALQTELPDLYAKYTYQQEIKMLVVK